MTHQGTIMNHDEFQAKGWTEKYFLQELTEKEADQFEEHYFQCGECAADVKNTAQFLDGARAVFGEETSLRAVPASAAQTQKPSESGGWRTWFRLPQLALASLAMLAVFGIYRWNQPTESDYSRFSTTEVLALQDRAEVDVLPTTEVKGPGVMIRFLAPGGVAAEPKSLKFTLVQDGKTVFEHRAQPLADEHLGFPVPADKLENGTYTISLKTANGQELGQTVRNFRQTKP
jgi:hypothetical protein